jgi:DnaJ-class molecular chaperone
MNKDYYQTLGLKRDASSEEIASNFKKLALRWNPKKAPEDYQTASYHFSEVAEAYDVLSDPIKRSFYDKYGWEKFKEGFYADG